MRYEPQKSGIFSVNLRQNGVILMLLIESSEFELYFALFFNLIRYLSAEIWLSKVQHFLIRKIVYQNFCRFLKFIIFDLIKKFWYTLISLNFLIKKRIYLDRNLILK